MILKQLLLLRLSSTYLGPKIAINLLDVTTPEPEKKTITSSMTFFDGF